MPLFVHYAQKAVLFFYIGWQKSSIISLEKSAKKRYNNFSYLALVSINKGETPYGDHYHQKHS